MRRAPKLRVHRRSALTFLLMIALSDAKNARSICIGVIAGLNFGKRNMKREDATRMQWVSGRINTERVNSGMWKRFWTLIKQGTKIEKAKKETIFISALRPQDLFVKLYWNETTKGRKRLSVQLECTKYIEKGAWKKEHSLCWEGLISKDEQGKG